MYYYLSWLSVFSRALLCFVLLLSEVRTEHLSATILAFWIMYSVGKYLFVSGGRANILARASSRQGGLLLERGSKWHSLIISGI